MFRKLKDKLKKILDSYRNVQMPECIAKKHDMGFIWGCIIVGGSLLFGILFFIRGGSFSSILFPAFLGLCFILVGMAIKLNVAINGIRVIEGECINIIDAGKIPFRSFIDSNVGIRVIIQTQTELVSIILSDRKQTPVIGQFIRIYLPERPSFHRDSQGIVHYQNIYGIEYFVETVDEAPPK